MDNHTYISESSTQEIELAQKRQTEQPVPINDRTSVKINTIQTAESRLLISKPTNDQLFEHLSKLKDKVDIKIRIHDDPTGLLKVREINFFHHLLLTH